ncbi:MAG: flagella associated [Trebouxia sp. A1-2]|nr:MAG: flagella associated [Trebouxia sp. A1-2]
MSSQAMHTSGLLSTDEYVEPRRPVLPHVQSAGDATRSNADCTASCLSFEPRPQTPDHQKKYRQSVLHEPGKIVRHFGTAEDPLPEGSFGRATIARQGESVADYIKSYPQSSLAQWALQRAEDVYASSKREPLGKGYVRGHQIPNGLGIATPFGVAIHAKGNNVIGTMTGTGQALTLQPIPLALQPGQDLAASSARLCDQHWEEFQATNRDELGQVKRLGMAGRQLPADHIFGVPSKHELGSVSTLLKGDYSPEQLQDDADLGKSLKEGWRNLGPAGRIYGVPTVRKDIRAPRKQSIANAQNYGNEPNSMQLIHPSATAERGVTEQHYKQQMSKDVMRDIIGASGILMDSAVFDAIFQHAAQRDQCNDSCCLDSFMHSRQQWLAQKMQIHCTCL